MFAANSKVPRRRVLASVTAAALLAAVSAVTFNDLQSASAATCTIAAVGDIAGSDDYTTGAAKTAALVQQEAPSKVLVLGDLAYDNGTSAEFTKYYDPTWGPLKSITEPAPGNHEYNSGGTGYYGYFNGVAKNYSFDVCGWHFISVDPYANMGTAAAFIKSDAAANTGKPLGVFWHAPRYSSGSEHGSDASSQPLWAASVAAGAKLVLNGHDHNYERFAPMDANGKASATGTREFVSGNGGHHLRGLGTVVANSEKRITGTPGVLFLGLRSDGYDWNYKDVKGATGDTGSLSFTSATVPTSLTPTSVTPPSLTPTSLTPPSSTPTSLTSPPSTPASVPPATNAPSVTNAPASSTTPKVSTKVVSGISPLVVVRLSGFAPNADVKVNAVITGGKGTKTVKTDSAGHVVLAFSIPSRFTQGPVTVTATSGAQTAKSVANYSAG